MKEESANLKWLRSEHANYVGRWVALLEGDMLASASSRLALQDVLAMHPRVHDVGFYHIAHVDKPYQERVRAWAVECFGEDVANNKAERNHRFLEEALELAQAGGCSRAEVLALVDYVFGRPPGAVEQEVGGVCTTLATLCSAHGIDMEKAAENELARVHTRTDEIRRKNASKPRGSPLPGSPTVLVDPSVCEVCRLPFSVTGMGPTAKFPQLLTDDSFRFVHRRCAHPELYPDDPPREP